MLNKSDLAAQIAEENNLSTGQAKLALEKTLELIARRLADGDEINLTGFGKFSVAERAARTGRNPQTGETIQIAASRAPRFSAGAHLKNAVN